jgi:NOL1/NOP2/sun family putative RNA methylase
MSGREFFLHRYEELGWKYRQVEARQAIRINTINAEGKNVIERLNSRKVTLEKVSFLQDGYWVLKSGFSVGATSEYLLGLYSIQDAAAQIPVTLFSDLKGKTVLDACAAPGGKTVQLADLMWNTGTIIAFDIDKRRLTALSNQLERCRVENAIAYHLDARKASQMRIRYDRVLLDVPCSGNFVMDEKWFLRRTIADVERNAWIQRQILSEAARVLKNDGEIIYSTCSLEPEEDELNIDWALRNLNLRVERIECYGEKSPRRIFGKELDSSVENCRRIWPGQTQGFFVCKLRKEA